MRTKDNKLDSITTLRAVAALWVCLIHLGMICNYTAPGFFKTIIAEGQNGVGIFFVITGFILPYSLFKKNYLTRDFFTFMARRFFRIEPAYWASIVIVFLVGAQSISAISVQSVFLHLTYLVPFVKNAHWYSDIYWTLAIEFQFYLIIGIAYPFIMKLPAKLAVLSVLIPAILCIVLKANYRGIIVTNLYDFSAGFILFMWYIRKIDTRLFLISLLLFTGYVMAAVSIKSGVLPLITVSFIALFNNKLSFKPVLYIGNISYSLYLLHAPVSYAFVTAIKGVIVDPLSLFIACLILSIAISALFYAIIESPTLKFSKKINLSNHDARNK